MPPTDTLRVAIISDTHGLLDDNVANVVKNCDRVIHAGDICGAHVLEQLKNLCPHITAVAGNNDTSGLWPLEETHIVISLPQQTEIHLPGGIIAVEHGHRHGMHKPDHDSLRHSHVHARVVVYGHTHSMVIDKEKLPWVVNPGAAGHTRNRGGPSCLVLNINGDDWQIETLRFEMEQVA